MGVHKLWTLLEPSSKPVKLDSLNDQVLAVDASIWLYQFITALKHQKTKNNNGEFSLEENNVFVNAHLIGFFRRICKLLHYGIKPVFIFDGEVCELKKNTIMERKKRKEGNRESSKDVARRILAMQLLKRNIKNKKGIANEVDESHEEEINKHMTQRNSEWELPEQKTLPTEYDDGRLAAIDEYEKTVNQMEDELQGIDLESINPASKEFNNLPKSTQYMILYALRSKSRLRMGYSMEQLKAMFPDPVEFSKFQIEMVKRRNFFSQKLLDSTGKHGNSMVTTGKVSGTKKMYMLIKTDNGWAMSLDNNDGSTKETAIDITNDDIEKIKHERNNEIRDTESEDWEDVDLDVDKEKEEVVEDYSIKALLDATKNRLREKTPIKTKMTDADEEKFEIPHFSTANLTSLNEEGRNNVNSDSNFQKQEPEEFEDVKLDGDIVKPVKKKQKVMNFSLFNDNRDDKKADFIDLVDNHDILETPQVVDLSDEYAHEETNKHNDINNADCADDRIALPVGGKQLEKEEDKDESDKFFNLTFAVGKNDDVSPITLDTESKDTFNVESEKKYQDHLSESSIDFVDGRSEQEEEQQPDLSESYIDFVDVENVSNKSEDEQVDHPFNDTANKDQKEDKIVDESIKNESENKDTNFTNEHHEIKDEKATGIFDLEEDDDEKPLGITKELVETNFENLDDSDDAFLEDAGLEKNDYQERKINQYEFFEDDEEELVQQIDKEEEDYKDLVNSKDESQLNQVFVEDGNTAVTDSTPHNDILGYSQLISRYRKLQRDAEEVTPQMVEEVQELLQHFGIPYLTAPMEAEAQCAELMRLKLVDGIITDDSDVFLFGGSKVYRKMFQEKQFVEFYDLETIYGTLGLSRDFLIDLAFLLGSDYTLGIKGIGPVAAVEILANFGSLKNFKEWYHDGMHNAEKIANEKGFEKALRKKLTSNNIILSETWPYSDVIKEYKTPTVDKDETPFKWGKPDLDRLRALMRTYLSWSDGKTDEVLIPLIKEMNKKSKSKQRKLTDFFPVDYSLHSYESLSSRLKKAVEKLKSSKS
ncbi:related to DNA repair protein RAD2 [Hanseniaspora guilliermondii]|uniref:Related to DNA repair protein RAD2 n=1 Tax=Hanseniaspora guilliermondii TaxID=56406 RepID=A0A1L0B389_9ASCO|nr:related to DNA repair protein RAD2 [Hanseniaspora guilliermondii]